MRLQVSLKLKVLNNKSPKQLKKDTFDTLKSNLSCLQPVQLPICATGGILSSKYSVYHGLKST